MALEVGFGSPVEHEEPADAHRILIVDDDPETRTLLRRVLAADGYAVETAPDGRIALEMVTASPPDLLITDLIMPRLSGWSLFARVRRLAPMLPIILISGSDPGLRHRGQSLPGHVAFLRKPFALDQLLATVTRLLAGIGSERDTMPGLDDEESSRGDS
jgi:two-component system, OmpR family, response regulator MprA